MKIRKKYLGIKLIKSINSKKSYHAWYYCVYTFIDAFKKSTLWPKQFTLVKKRFLNSLNVCN